MVSRSAVGLFQSLLLLHVAGTVTAERDPQSSTDVLRRSHWARQRQRREKQGFNPEESNCIKCHTQAALAFAGSESTRLALPGPRAALLFQGTLPAITAAGGVKPWRAPSRSDWRPRPPKAAIMSHPQASARRRCSGDPADASNA